jgi:hypothetical protein
MTLRDTRMMRGERGRECLLLPMTLFRLPLLCPQKRHRPRPRHRRWWRLRLRQQKQLWLKSLSRNAGRPRVRPRHAAARNRNHCEGNAHVPKYKLNRFRVPEQLGVFTFTFIYSRFLYCKFSVVAPPLPRTHCILCVV